jgi:hypothetical protein
MFQIDMESGKLKAKLLPVLSVLSAMGVDRSINPRKGS